MTQDEILKTIDELIRRHGYKVRGRVPSGWVILSPDGRLVHEDSLEEEIERITAPKSERA